jgi:hypothetical protein
VQRNIEAFSCNHRCCGEAMSITQPECICSLSQPSPVVCPEPHYFSTLSRKRHAFPKTFLNTNYVLWLSLQLVSDIFRILRRNERHMIKNMYWSSFKVPFVLVRIWWNFNFLGRFSINPQISNIIKICPVGAEFFIRTGGRTDRRTGITKLTVTFYNFTNAPQTVAKFWATWELTIVIVKYKLHNKSTAANMNLLTMLKFWIVLNVY